MLKDITLGQFFPGNTIVHRLDPRTKILAVILYIVALFSADSVLTYVLAAAVLALLGLGAALLLLPLGKRMVCLRFNRIMHLLVRMRTCR